MGYGRFGRLLRVDLPLALPGILTGLRLATVSTVALVTVGALVGKGGLGDLILGGFRNNFYKARDPHRRDAVRAARAGARPAPGRRRAGC